MSRKWSAGCALLSVLALAAAACAPTGGGGGAVNPPPTAVASATPTSGVAPLTVAFSSLGSSDSNGTITGYSWSFGDGAPASTLPSPGHIYSSAGSFTAVLTVTDDGGATGTATNVITVSANTPPVAVATATPTSGKEPLTVSLSSLGSTDPDGTIASASWNFGDGSPATTSPNPSHVYTLAGVYVASLTVIDNQGSANTATASITVNANQAPSAAASATPTSGKEPLTVAFSSAGSTDADGTVVARSWNFGDGSPSTSVANPSHVYAIAGSYTATLTVTDDNNATDAKTVAITSNANQAPTAVANGSPTGGQVPLVVNFNGSLSTDPDGTIVSFLWNFGGGNTNASTLTPQFTFGTIGVYPVTLTVTDDNGVSNTATLNINVNPIPNVPPTAAAACTPGSGKVDLTISCSSAGSADSDGAIAAYAWDFGDGGTSNQANPSHVYTSSGTKIATLTVIDNSNGTATATVSTVVIANVAPNAIATGTPLTGKEPLVVSFGSAGSTDPDGVISSRSWDFGDGSNSTSASPSHTYLAAGTYNAVLTVSDDNGATDTDAVSITVTPNQVPTAVANASPQTGRRSLTASFNGSSSIDPDGSITSYHWDFGDSATSTTPNPTHVYAAGTFTASLYVTDNNSVNSATVTLTITVHIDDDGDGYRAAGPNQTLPLDCNDSNAAINPGAADPLDVAATDSNCDGYDGVLSSTYFAKISTGVDSGACGPISSPCATIGQALTNATTNGKSVVQVAGGSYPKFTMANAKTVRGGYGQTFTTRTGGDTTTVNGSFDPGLDSHYAILANGITTMSTISDITVQGGDGSAANKSTYGVIVGGSTTALTLDTDSINGGTGVNATGVLVQTTSAATINNSTVNSGTPTGAGSSGFGVRSLTSSTATILNSTVTAQAGVAGAASGAATPGAAAAGCNGSAGGNAGGPSTPGNGGGSCGGSGVTTSGAGGTGGDYSSAGASGSNGGGGASGGSGGCGTLFGSGCTTPGNGTAGTVGVAGVAGAGGGSGVGTAAGTWVGINGAAGGTGGSGGGGGGGGGGGSASASGGGGGAGGGGGISGTGGTGGGGHGGGSFATYAYNASLTITNSTLTANGGGVGGKGSNGGAGGAGGSGGSGGTKSCCSAKDGGIGGLGAGGAGGGGAGGGAGGPSIAIFHNGTGALATTGGTQSRSATASAAGLGGSAGVGGGAAAAGTTGSAGTAGMLFRVWNNGATTS